MRLAPVALVLSLASTAAAAPRLRWLDGAGNAVDGVEPTRTAPRPLPDDPMAPSDEVSFRLVIELPAGDESASRLTIVSEGSSGHEIDRLPLAGMRTVACPADAAAGSACVSSLPLRVALDESDRRHPSVAMRSIQGEVGGSLSVRSTTELGRTPVWGPLREARYLRGKLRVRLVRVRPKGPPPFGQTDAMALGLARTQVSRTSAIWGQCGVSFGPPEQADVALVDPPPSALVAVGCGGALPAAGGGQIRLRVDGREVSLATLADETPRGAARRLSAAIEALGLRVQLSDNPRQAFDALPTTDLVVRRRDGTLVTIESTPPASSDARLGVCVGAVDLTDGLQHFTDLDATAGTLEERTLMRSIEDGDPRTIEAVFIPSFGTGGRIGESFIAGDHGGLGNMLIEDRAGIRADIFSFALAHELGHVLLDVPGHSDDYGVDTPWRLMDSDAADPSPFGPRRLTLTECERMLRQSGPHAPSPMLTPWAPASSRPAAAPAARRAAPRKR